MFIPDQPKSFGGAAEDGPHENPVPASAEANASVRRARFRRWLWRKSPYIVIFTLVATLLTILLWNRVVIVIHSGNAGVLYRLFTGTQIDYVYPEGLELIFPWDTMYLYQIRKQIALHEFDVLTVKGLTVRLALAIRYQPEVQLLGILHKRIGPDYLERVIIPQTESVMRKELGNYTAEDIYTNKEGLLTNTILLALDEVGRNFVQVEDIIIRSITLPEKIRSAIEDKLTQEELLKSYEFRLQTAHKEAERLRIEANGIKDYQELIDKTLNDKVLKHAGIQATRDLARSNNAKIVVIGSGKDGLPLILNTQ